MRASQGGRSEELVNTRRRRFQPLSPSQTVGSSSQLFIIGSSGCGAEERRKYA